MFPSKRLLLFVLISLTVVDASPPPPPCGAGKATLSFVTRIHTLDDAKKDRARAYALKHRHPGKRNKHLNVENAVVSYIAKIGLGSPVAHYKLQVDTGSITTWVGAAKPYIQTNTSRSTGRTISVNYRDGTELRGAMWSDTLTLGDLVIENQIIGVSTSTVDFNDFDGILGLYSSNANGEGTAVMKNLLSQEKISEDILGIYFVPASESSSKGTLTFGGYDSSVITGLVNYAPLTTSPASMRWGIDLSISYDDTSQAILSSTGGIVDTGTTFIAIASDAFQRYKDATGGITDPTTGLLRITNHQYAKLKTLSFHIGNTTYDLSPNAQIWPRSLNTLIGGSSDSIYLVVCNIGTPSGPAIGFILGYTFLERYYSIFDNTNRQVGFAPTAYTNVTTN